MFVLIQDAENNVSLPLAVHGTKGLFKVVRNQGSGTLDGEQLMLDGILSGRQYVHAVAMACIDLVTYLFQGALEIDIGNEVGVSTKSLPCPLGVDGVNFISLAVDEVLSFQKDKLVNLGAEIEHKVIKVQIRQNLDNSSFRQTGGKLPEMLLIGKPVGHVVEEGGTRPLPVQEFDVRDDVVEVVSEDTLPAGNENRLACKGAGIFFYIEFWQCKIRLLLIPLLFFQPLFSLLHWLRS